MYDFMRTAVERLYTGRCNVINYREVDDEYGTTTHKSITVAENQPCRLSYNNSPNGTQTDRTDNITQTIKLFISPDINIRAGSDITVVQNGVEAEFVASGIPKKYSSHQEIELISKEEYS